MDKNYHKNLFREIPEEARKKINKQASIESKYIEWLYNYRKENNCEPLIKLCEQIYKSLNQ
jgi:hypothetical protein